MYWKPHIFGFYIYTESCNPKWSSKCVREYLVLRSLLRNRMSLLKKKISLYNTVKFWPFYTPPHWLTWWLRWELSIVTRSYCMNQSALAVGYKQRVLMHEHQGWNVRHGLCHIYMIYVYIWVVYSFCLFCCLFIIVTTQFVALYKPCKPKPKFR